MVSRAVLVIIFSSLLLLTVSPLPKHDVFRPLSIPTPPPPPDEAPSPRRDNQSSSGDGSVWQKTLDTLEVALQDITDWLNGVVEDLQHSIEQGISQHLQGLIDQVIQQVTQAYEEMLNQTCGSTFLPAGGIAGVWIYSRYMRKQDRS